MFLKHIAIDGYIPFSHVGNKHVEFSPTEPGVCILGGNGSGKSSLLRLITPSPAQRPSFAKNGKVEIEWEHNGSVYVTSSDFSNATSPNHFVKDGVELNEGGTGETQKDLIEEHLGYRSCISDVLSGEVKICEMVKSARKQLFSEHYPSDLSFVLEYHKKVCSQIRAYANQIKLLQTREGSLNAALINPTEIKRLQDFKASAERIIDRVDKANLLLENEIEQLRNHEAMRHEYHPEDLEGIIHEIHQIHDNYLSELLDIKDARELGENINQEALGVDYAKFNTELAHLEKEKEAVANSLQDIRDELNKFTNLKYASNDDQKSSLLKELGVVKRDLAVLEDNKTWEGTGLIQHDKLLDVIELEREISDLISQIHPYAGQLLDQEAVSKLKNDSYIAKNTIATLQREKNELTSELNKAQDRLAALNKNSYPLDCTRTCALRATLEGSVRDVQMRIDKIKDRIGSIDAHMTASSELITKNDKQLQESAPALPVMKALWDILTNNYLQEIALKDETFVDCLNAHCSDIVNRIRLAAEASKSFYRYKNLKDRKEQIEHTLSMMESVEKTQLSAEVINGIIADREQKIETGLRRLTDIEGQCNELVRRMDRITHVGGLIRTLGEIINRAETALNIKLIRTRIEFDKEMIKEHTAIKNDLNSKLRDIERTLQDQQRVTDVLATEILPTLEKIRKDKDKWEAVEAGLRPSKGLPSIYLVRFINRLIALANSYIKEVWNHDMELVYLKEDDELDFTLPVMMYKATVVKDCGMCSNGEQAIINLAMTLAICVERGYLKNYPIILDEVDGALTPEHRDRLVGLISRLLEAGDIHQLFLVNHFAIQTGLTNSEAVVLSSDGIVVPSEKCNVNAVIN